MKTAHTPAPWHAISYFLVSSHPDSDDHDIARFDVGGHNYGERAKNNAARAVACVNACEGIDDPAAALAEVRALLDAFSDSIEYGQRIVLTNTTRAQLHHLLDVLGPAR